MGKGTCTSLWTPRARCSISSLILLWLVLTFGERERWNKAYSRRRPIMDFNDAWGALEICDRKATAQLEGRVGVQCLPPNQLDVCYQLSALPAFQRLVSSSERTGAGGAGPSCTAAPDAQLWCATELHTASRNAARKTQGWACCGRDVEHHDSSGPQSRRWPSWRT